MESIEFMIENTNTKINKIINKRKVTTRSENSEKTKKGMSNVNQSDSLMFLSLMIDFITLMR